MPYSVTVNDELKRLSVNWSGVVLDDDIHACQREMLAISGTQEYDVISDFNGAESLKVTAEGIQQVSKVGAEHDEGLAIRMAFVTKTNFEFGMSRMYGSVRGGQSKNTRTIRVFRNLEDAEAWLDGIETT